MKTAIAALAILLVLLQLADAATTAIGLSYARVREGNPFARFFIRMFGVIPGLAVMKAGGMAGMGALILMMPPEEQLIGLILGCALYAWVAYNNLRVIRRAKARARAKREAAASP
ncbi:MAG TPA: DUF5658 family protein [Allosphingosinicella sp.]|nr:DUF5658 family protein [Allosphingosinicella sp.]